jgi:hypothetical protein
MSIFATAETQQLHEFIAVKKAYLTKTFILLLLTIQGTV